MKRTLLTLLATILLQQQAIPQSQPPNDLINPTRPIPTGKAPSMQVKLIKDTPEEKTYVIVFLKGDEVLSGLTDFAAKYKVSDAHFTSIGAISSATTAWLDLNKKMYRPTVTNER